LRLRSRSASVIDRLLKNQHPLENRNNLRSYSPHPGPRPTSGEPRRNFSVRNLSTREPWLFRSPVLGSGIRRLDGEAVSGRRLASRWCDCRSPSQRVTRLGGTPDSLCFLNGFCLYGDRIPPTADRDRDRKLARLRRRFSRARCLQARPREENKVASQLAGENKAELVVTDASIERWEWYFQAIFAVDAYTPVSNRPDLLR